MGGWIEAYAREQAAKGRDPERPDWIAQYRASRGPKVHQLPELIATAPAPTAGPIELALRRAALTPASEQIAFREDLAKRNAPGALGTAFDIATGQLIAPFSNQAADAATDRALERFTAAGGDAATNADLFGTAAAGGAIFSNLAINRALPTGPAIQPSMPGREIAKRVVAGAAEDAAIGAGISATGGVIEGRELGDIASEAGRQALIQGGLGAAVRGAGAARGRQQHLRAEADSRAAADASRQARYDAAIQAENDIMGRIDEAPKIGDEAQAYRLDELLAEPGTSTAQAARAFDETIAAGQQPARQAQRQAIDQTQEVFPDVADALERRYPRSPLSMLRNERGALGVPDPDVHSFVQRAVSDKRSLGQQALGSVAERTAADVRRLAGVELGQAHHQILADDVRHILRRHGEPARGHVPVTEEDVARLPDILNDYDNMRLAGRGPDGQPRVQLEKRFNGTTYVVEEVYEPASKRGGFGRLRVKTMWKRPSRLGDAASETPATPTSETPPGTTSPTSPNVPRGADASNPEAGVGGVRMLTTLAGGGVGAATGAAVDDENPLRGAALGFVAGAGLGYRGGRAAEGPIFSALKNRRGAVGVKPEPASDEAIQRAIDEVIEESRHPVRPAAGPTDADDFANVSKFALDPTGESRLRGEIERVVKYHGLSPKQTITHEQTRKLASEIGLGDLPKDEINTRLNGPQMLAIRNIVSRNVEALERLYGRLKTGGLTPQDAATLDQNIAYIERENDALLSRFVRARTQTGRDLNNLKILANRVMDPFTWIAKAENMMKAQGETLTPDQRQRITELVKAEDRLGLIQYVAGLRKSSKTDQAVSLWKTGLLTNPKTHLANVIGNTAMAGLETAKDLPAALVDRVLGAATGVRSKSFDLAGTAKATWEGALRGIDEAKAIIKGVPSEQDLARWDLPRETTFKNPILRAYTQFISRALKAEDAVFRKAALQRALAEAGRVSGGPVTEEMALQAIRDAEYATFQNNSRLAQAGSGLRRGLKAPGHVVLPFTQTPGNVVSAALDYSPFGAVRTARDMYRLVKAVKSDASVSELRALQKAASESAGRVATGIAPFLAGYILARSGMMTGHRPEDKAERDQWNLEGKQENALLIRGKSYSLNRLSPLGNLMALGANYYNLEQEPDATPLGAGFAALGSVGTTATEQSFLSGLQDLNEAIESPARAGAKYGSNLLASTVPAVVGATARATDRTVRDTKGSIYDAFKSRVPGVSRTLPAQVNALGEPKQRTGSAAGEFLDPTNARAQQLDDPLIAELASVGVNVPELTPARANAARAEQYEAVLQSTQNPTVRAFLEQRLSRAKEGEQRGDFLGRAATEGQLLRRVLQSLIADPSYQQLSPLERRDMLERAIDTIRRAQAQQRR